MKMRKKGKGQEKGKPNKKSKRKRGQEIENSEGKIF
jgi:hypothetical protein